MNQKFSDLLIGLLFAVLVIGTGFMQTEMKSDPIMFMLLFGLLALVSLFAKESFLTSIPFYILLGTMFYINIFTLFDQILSVINPSDGWVTDGAGDRQRVMPTNWVWGVLAGFVLAPLAVLLYHKKIQRNKTLEIALTVVFIILTAVIYFKY